MCNIKFSIITITFNSEKTIERTLNSVLSQCYTDYEYIIVDGASKDSTVDIIRKYEPLFEGRMKWKSEPDTGIYNAMNKGILRSTGEIIGIVNSDDWLEPNALEIVNRAVLGNRGINAIYTGNIKFHYADGNNITMCSNKERLDKYAKKYMMGIYHPATFVSADIYKAIGLFDTNLKIYGDSEFINRCYYSNVNFIFINDVLSNMSDGGVSNVYNKKMYKDRIYILKKYCKNKLEYYRLLMESIIKSIIKKNTPEFLVRNYRKITCK